MNKKNLKIIIYLNADTIIKLNKLAIKLFVQKKADSHEVLNYSRILKIINKCEETKGDIYDKAVILLKGLVQYHAFASGNRRTAILATIVFCIWNKQKVYIPNNPTNSKVLIGIREDFYSNNKIKNWIKNGKIKTFKR